MNLKVELKIKDRSVYFSEECKHIVEERLIQNYYAFWQSQGKVKIVLEAVPMVNFKSAILESRANGILSILIKEVKSQTKIYPITKIDLFEAQNHQTWTSLNPLYSSSSKSLIEGALLPVSNVLDKNSRLEIKLFDDKKLLGTITFNVKELLKSEVRNIHRVFDDDVQFDFAISLFHC